MDLFFSLSSTNTCSLEKSSDKFFELSHFLTSNFLPDDNLRPDLCFTEPFMSRRLMIKLVTVTVWKQF